MSEAMNSDIKRKCELFERAIGKYPGARARFFTYSLSHKVLVIQLERFNEAVGLHIACSDVDWLAGPTDWITQGIQLEYRGAGREMTCILREAEAGLEVRCGGFQLMHNVPVR